MKLRSLAAAVLIVSLLFIYGCNRAEYGDRTSPGQPAARREAGPLPDNAFKAQISLVDPPAKLRPAQKDTLQVRVKNESEAQWYARGGELNTHPDNRYYIAAGNRWLKADGRTLVSNMDGRYGLSKDLKPGEDVTIPLQVTAPNEPGQYVLEVDLVQERVAWFSDRGSPTAKVNIIVEK